MVHIKYDNITGIILGLDPENKFINELGWISATEAAYEYILEHNGNCLIDLDSLTDIETYNLKSSKVKQLLDNASTDKEKEEILNTLPVIIDKINIIMAQNTPQQAIASKIRHFNNMCNMMITAGVLFEINDNLYQFSFKLEDQNNYAELNNFIDKGLLNEETGVNIKPNENDEYINVSPIIFKDLYNELLKNKFYHLYYLKELTKYIKTFNDTKQIERVQYEDILPNEPYQIELEEKMKIWR